MSLIRFGGFSSLFTGLSIIYIKDWEGRSRTDLFRETNSVNDPFFFSYKIKFRKKSDITVLEPFLSENLRRFYVMNGRFLEFFN